MHGRWKQVFIFSVRTELLITSYFFFSIVSKNCGRTSLTSSIRYELKAEKNKHAFDKKAVGKVIVATSWREFVDLRSSCWYYVSTWFAFQISDTFFLMVYLWHQRIQSHLIPYWIFIIAWKLQLYGPSNKNQMFHVFPRALWTSCFKLNVSNGNLLSWLTMLNHSPYTGMFVLLICSTDAYYPSNFYQIT